MNSHSIVCINVKELFVQGSRHIWCLIDRKEIGTHKHIVRKRTLKYLASLVE